MFVVFLCNISHIFIQLSEKLLLVNQNIKFSMNLLSTICENNNLSGKTNLQSNSIVQFIKLHFFIMIATVVIIIAYSIVVTGKTEKVMVKAIPVALLNSERRAYQVLLKMRKVYLAMDVRFPLFQSEQVLELQCLYTTGLRPFRT